MRIRDSCRKALVEKVSDKKLTEAMDEFIDICSMHSRYLEGDFTQHMVAFMLRRSRVRRALRNGLVKELSSY